MKRSIVVTLCSLFLVPTLFSQTGSINNTLGSGGVFTVKNGSSNNLMTVDESTGQLSATRVKIDGVPSFTASLIGESGIESGDTLTSWTEASGYGSHDNSGSFNESTGQFVAPRSGFYFFSAGMELAASCTTATLYIFGNAQPTSLAARGSLVFTGAVNLSTSGILKLNSGDVVMLRLTMTGLTGTGSSGTGWFSGYLVSDF